MRLQANHFKERTPRETVNFLKQKLDELGIKIKEDWLPASEVNSYSLRITVEGTNIGSNGKGVSKDYAQASAYAEFFERLQNDLLFNTYVSSHLDDDKDFKEDPNIESDAKIMTAEQIVEENNAFTNFFFKDRNMENSTKKEKISKFKELNRFEYLLYGKENYYICLPFYDCTSNKIVYLPKFAYGRYYGSNGMAAGNAPAEALVQGMSEIIERIVQKKLFDEKPSCPDIPEEYIKKFPYIYEMYKKLKNNKDVTVNLKDCSFNGVYPVAGLFVREKNTGNYGIKLGCHPDFTLAMERTFTEAAQGNNIKEYCDRSVLDFNNTGVCDSTNIGNSFKTGLAQYPYELFNKDNTYDFSPVIEVKDKTNEDLLKQLIDNLENKGYHVLIRNVSYLGFPSYHIIVPGLSELRPGKDINFRAANTRDFVTKLLTNPSLINKENAQYLLATFGYFSRSTLSNRLSSYYPDIDNLILPGEKFNSDIAYLSCMCEIVLGDYKSAQKYMNTVLRNAVDAKVPLEDAKKLYVIKYYIDGFIKFNNHNKTMSYLKDWFDDELLDFVSELFSDPSKIIAKQYPSFEDWTNNSNFKHQVEIFNLKKKLRKISKEENIVQGFPLKGGVMYE